jgi:hypothetical protein
MSLPHTKKIILHFESLTVMSLAVCPTGLSTLSMVVTVSHSTSHWQILAQTWQVIHAQSMVFQVLESLSFQLRDCVSLPRTLNASKP